MNIIYIEEDVDAALARRLEVFENLISPNIIHENRSRQISLISGIQFIFITKDELDRVRGLNMAAIFQNCSLDSHDKNGLIIQVRML